MAIYVSKDIDKEFLLTTLKDCYLEYLRSELFNNRNKKHLLLNMNSYLVENYNVEIRKIFTSVIENLIVTTQGDNYKLTLNEFAIVTKNYTLGMFIRLIDYGNTEIRGLHIFDKVEKYIQSRLNAIFTLHTLKGLTKDVN